MADIRSEELAGDQPARHPGLPTLPPMGDEVKPGDPAILGRDGSRKRTRRWSSRSRWRFCWRRRSPTRASAPHEAITPSKLIAGAQPGKTYRLTGKVVDGSIGDIPGGKSFRVRDRDGTAAVKVSYVGSVPDPFREGREIVVTVTQER